MPEGVDLQSRVPGELLAWRRTTTGEWVGWVCLPVRRGEEIRYVYQYVVGGGPVAARGRPGQEITRRFPRSLTAAEPVVPAWRACSRHLGLTTMRGCVIGWVISAVLLVVGLVFTFTPNPVIGIVLFAVGVVGHRPRDPRRPARAQGTGRLTTRPGTHDGPATREGDRAVGVS